MPTKQLWSSEPMGASAEAGPPTLVSLPAILGARAADAYDHHAILLEREFDEVLPGAFGLRRSAPKATRSSRRRRRYSADKTPWSFIFGFTLIGVMALAAQISTVVGAAVGVIAVATIGYAWFTARWLRAKLVLTNLDLQVTFTFLGLIVDHFTMELNELLCLEAQSDCLTARTARRELHLRINTARETLAAIESVLLRRCAIFPSYDVFGHLRSIPEHQQKAIASKEGKEKAPCARVALRYRGRRLVVDTGQLDGLAMPEYLRWMPFVKAPHEIGFGHDGKEPSKALSRITLHAEDLRRGASCRILFAPQAWEAVLTREGWQGGGGVWLQGEVELVANLFRDRLPLSSSLAALAPKLPGAVLDLSPVRVIFQRAGTKTQLPIFARLVPVMDELLAVARGSELSASTEGITLVEFAPAPEDEVWCQFCGDHLDLATAHRCPDCQTPHHRDCWEFNGGCTTYACACGPGN